MNLDGIAREELPEILCRMPKAELHILHRRLAGAGTDL